MVIRGIGILIPVVILFIYLIATGAIKDFINYAILGISTFSNNIQYAKLFENKKIEIKILALLIPISIIVNTVILVIMKLLKKENEKIKIIATILLYSLSIIIVIYPISDEIHFLIGSLIPAIGIIYILKILGEKIYNKINYIKKYKTYKITTLMIWIILLATILMTCINNLYQYINEDKNIEIKHYKNIEIGEYLQERINEMDNYILEKEKEGKKVYILDAEAAIVMIPIDKYNKDYDMFLIGNIGKDGEESQIEKIKQREENIIYIIRRKEIPQNWQAPKKTIEYIRENLNLIGTINAYEIYE